MAGDLRGGLVFKEDQAIEVRLLLPKEAFVYVMSLDGREADLLFPAEGEEAPLRGSVLLPGGGEAWKLKGAKPGRYLLLIGIRASALTLEERAASAAAFKSLPDPIAEEEVHRAALSFFDDLRIFPFTVVP